jgi:hypothetical protein
MLNSISLRVTALRFSIEPWLFAPPMTAPANHSFIAFGHFLTIHPAIHLTDRSGYVKCSLVVG